MTRAAAMLLAAALVAGDWSHMGLDDARSRASAETVGTTWTLDWSYTGVDVTIASPVAADGRVFVGDTSGRLHGVDAVTGSGWTAQVTAPIQCSPLAHRGRVIIGDSRFRFVEVDAAGGALGFDQPGGGSLVSSPVAGSNAFFSGVGVPSNSLAAFDLDTGATLWTEPLGQASFGSPIRDAGIVYITSNDGSLRAFAETGGPALWTVTLPGATRDASPVLSGGAIFVPTLNPSVRVCRVSVAGTLDWTSPVITDPAPPAGATTARAVSSPVVIGGAVFVVARFDHVASGVYTSKEYLYALDAATGAAFGAPWPLALGTVSGPDSNSWPQARLCPTPTVVNTPVGPGLVVASSASATVRLISSAGAILTSATLDGHSIASPIVANARIHFVTYPGTLYAFTHDANAAPTPPTGFSPTAGAVTPTTTPTLSWWGAADADGDPLTYLVRGDDDGEFLRDWDFEIATTGTSATAPALPVGAWIRWGVRVTDTDGAMSSWSAAQDFWVITSGAPAAPKNFAAAPGNAQVTLTWTSPSDPSVVTYVLSTGSGGSWGPYVDVGNVTTHVATGLTNGAPYTFRLRSRDGAGVDSAPVEASATPVAPVSIGGVPYPDLPTAAAFAVPGETIQLGYGTFTLPSALGLKEGVSLVGMSPHDTAVIGVPTDAVIRLIAGALPRGRIAMMTIGGGLVGVDTNGYAVVIENCIIEGNDTGVLVAAASDCLIRNDTIANNASYGVFSASSIAVVKNSIVTGNGIGLSGPAAMACAYNDVYSNLTADYSGAAPGGGSLSTPVAFTSGWMEGPPAIDAGDPADAYGSEPENNGDRVNLGAYGNTAWAATSPPGGGGGSGGGGGGGGGGCLAGAAAPRFALLALAAALALALGRGRLNGAA